MTDTLEDCGIDPDRTPVDSLPDHAQWALVGYFESLEEDA